MPETFENDGTWERVTGPDHYICVYVKGKEFIIVDRITREVISHGGTTNPEALEKAAANARFQCIVERISRPE